MNPKAKKIVYGVVLAASTALLLPTLLDSSNRAAPEPLPEIPAEGPVSAAAGEGHGEESVARAGLVPRLEIPRKAPLEHDPDVVPATPEESARAVEHATAEEDELERLASRSELVGSLERSMDLLENFAPTASLPDLDRLAASWNGTSMRTPPGDDDSTPLITTSAPLGMDPLVDYLTVNRLSGIIHGESDQAAMVGGRILRVGDDLLLGQALVKVIEPRHLIVVYRDEDVRVDLPPLRPRTRPGSNFDDTDSPDDGDPSGDDSSSPENPMEGSDA